MFRRGGEIEAYSFQYKFLRDLKSDFSDRGRVYFPGVDFSNFDSNTKKIIEADIQRDFDNAYRGIMRLPESAKKGVYLAYIYYLNLFRRIQQMPIKRIQTERIRVPDTIKLALLAKTFLQSRLNIL